MTGLVSSNTIKPKESGKIRVTLDPIGKKGKIKKTVTVYSNDAKESVKEIKIYATVEHSVTLSPNLRMEKVLFSQKCKSCHANRGYEKAGKPLYDAICAYCHGEKGEGKSAKPFKKMSKGHIRDWTAKGRKGSGMPGFSKEKGGPLNDIQIDSLVTYIRSLVPE